MRMHLLAVGARRPGWEQAGFEEYARRLPADCALELVEIAATKRRKGTAASRAVAEEGERMLARIPRRARVVALDERGRPWSTLELSERLQRWREEAADVALLIGGADGLAPACLEAAREVWSLSALTLPHGLVRILVAEQLYRAWSIAGNHPYHRGS